MALGSHVVFVELEQFGDFFFGAVALWVESLVLLHEVLHLVAKTNVIRTNVRIVLETQFFQVFRLRTNNLLVKLILRKQITEL